MSKRNKIIYWVFTVWVAFGMTSTGIMQLMHTDVEIELMNRLGYPAYVLTILGAWKLLAAVAILVPKSPLIKEWAYAGMFFNMSGALISHIFVGNGMGDIFPTVFFLALIFMSWYFRPADRAFTQRVA